MDSGIAAAPPRTDLQTAPRGRLPQGFSPAAEILHPFHGDDPPSPVQQLGACRPPARPRPAPRPDPRQKPPASSPAQAGPQADHPAEILFWP